MSSCSRPNGDQSFGGPPQIFETMDFPANSIQERYATLEEAKAGHARILAELSEAGGA